MKKKIFLFLCLFCFLFFVIKYYTLNEKRVISHKEVFKVGGNFDVSAGFNPIFLIDSYNLLICELVFSSLLKMNHDYEIVPDLADSWEISENNKEIRFKIKQNVTFHDGNPLTAHDVKATFNALSDPKIYRFYQLYEFIDKAIVLNNHEIKFVLKKKFSKIAKLFMFFMYPSHVSFTDNQSSFTKHPVGSGPYKFTEVFENGVIELIKNEDYYGKVPDIGQIHFIHFSNKKNEWAGFLRGDIDFYRHLTPNQIQMIKDNESFQIIETLQLKYFILCINSKKINDKYIIKAIQYSIDRDMIIEQAFKGQAVKVNAPVKLSQNSESQIKHQEYNPGLALEYLKKANLKDFDGNGYLDDDSGKEMIINLSIMDKSLDYKKIAKCIQMNLAKIGIKTKIKFLKDDFLKRKFFKDDDFEILLDVKVFNVKAFSFKYWIETIGMKPYIIENEELAKLYWEYNQNISNTREEEIVVDMMKIISNESNVVFLVRPFDLYALSSRIDLNGTRFAPLFRWFKVVNLKIGKGGLDEV